MRRRDFIVLAGAAAAWPLAARAAQPDRIPRIGYLGLGTAINPAFLQKLSDLGYIEGENLHIEYRSAEGDERRLPGLAAELVDLKVDLIVTYAAGVYAAARATRTIPIVMATGADVVADGVAASLAHPGGNVTGLTFFYPELMAKRLELLKRAAPSMRRAGVLLAEDNPANRDVLDKMGVVAESLQVELRPIRIRALGELENAIAAAAAEPVGGLEAVDNPMFTSGAGPAAIAAIATRRRLPSIGSLGLARSGCLLGYSVSFPEMYRHAAVFADKILKGAKPSDIPIEQATRFQTIVNLKTAKAIGVEPPPLLLASADEVIE